MAQHFSAQIDICFRRALLILLQELAEAIDGMASNGEANLLRLSRGIFPVLPGMNGPVNTRRMEELSLMMETFRHALIVEDGTGAKTAVESSSFSIMKDNRNRIARMETIVELVRAVSGLLRNARLRQDAEPLLEELQSVIQMVAVEVLEIRGSRAMRSILHV